MTNTITQIWNGDLSPITEFGQANREKKQLQGLMQRNLEKLAEALDDQQKELMGKYCDCVNEYIVVANEQAFCDGFCLATKIVAEAMHHADDRY